MKGDLWGLFLFTDAYGAQHEGLMRTHEAGDCAGEPCALHNPSDHHMRAWRLHWRADRRLMERLCPCGIGHPDPDHMAHVLRTRGAAAVAVEGIHGCCGHCDPDYIEEESE